MNIIELRVEFNNYDENIKKKHFLNKLKYFYNKINPNLKLLKKLCILDLFYERQTEILSNFINSPTGPTGKSDYTLKNTESVENTGVTGLTKDDRLKNYFDIMNSNLKFFTRKICFNDSLLKEVLESNLCENLKNFLINLFDFQENENKFSILYLYCLLKGKKYINDIKSMIYMLNYKDNRFEELISFLIYKNIPCCLFIGRNNKIFFEFMKK